MKLKLFLIFACGVLLALACKHDGEREISMAVIVDDSDPAQRGVFILSPGKGGVWTTMPSPLHRSEAPKRIVRRQIDEEAIKSAIAEVPTIAGDLKPPFKPGGEADYVTYLIDDQGRANQRWHDGSGKMKTVVKGLKDTIGRELSKERAVEFVERLNISNPEVKAVVGLITEE